MRAAFAVLALASAVFAAPQAAQPLPAGQTHQVNVGMGGLTFQPNTVTANVGDIIEFTFFPKNHTLTQSTFAAPCTPAFNQSTGQAGFNSGFNQATTTTFGPLKLQVTTGTPLWFYCMQANHCQQGMVFAVNPTAAKTFAAFQAAAMASTPGAAPAADAPAAGAPAAGAPASSAPAAGAPAAGAPAATTPGTIAGAPAASVPGAATTDSGVAPAATNATGGATPPLPGAASSVSVARVGVLAVALAAGALLL